MLAGRTYAMDEKITQTSQDPPVFIPKQNLPYGKARERLHVLGHLVGKFRPFTEYEMKEIRALQTKAKIEAVLDKIMTEKAK
jgi:hypothetical protein